MGANAIGQHAGPRRGVDGVGCLRAMCEQAYVVRHDDVMSKVVLALRGDARKTYHSWRSRVACAHDCVARE